MYLFLHDITLKFPIGTYNYQNMEDKIKNKNIKKIIIPNGLAASIITNTNISFHLQKGIYDKDLNKLKNNIKTIYVYQKKYFFQHKNLIAPSNLRDKINNSLIIINKDGNNKCLTQGLFCFNKLKKSKLDSFLPKSFKIGKNIGVSFYQKDNYCSPSVHLTFGYYNQETLKKRGLNQINSIAVYPKKYLFKFKNKILPKIK